MAASRKRSETVYRFDTTEPNKKIEVSVAYCEGGSNYFSGGVNARAFYMHFTPVTLETFEGTTIKSFMMFHGCKAKIEEVKRFNAKRMDALVEQIRGECQRRDPHIMQIVNRVLAEENMTLAEPVEAA